MLHLSDTGCVVKPTKKSDVYYFGILAYEVIFLKEAWPNVSFQLIPSVKAGYHPSMPSDSPQLLSKLFESCWHHDST